MSNTKMLIDATHPEETRVVVQRNGRVEEFDFESAARKLLRGNIYLAKVTRVEPSLQAAFVDYGGNRHGFLAFNEIHPDYYQIPVADRRALLEEEAAAEAELEAAADRRAEALARRGGPRGGKAETGVAEAAGDEFAEPSRGAESEETAHIVDVEEEEHIEEVGGDAEGDEAPQVVASAIERSSDDVRSEEPTSADISDERAAEAAISKDADDEESRTAQDEAAGEWAAEDDESGSGDAALASRDNDAGETELPEGGAQISARRYGGNDDASGPELRDESASRPRRRPRSYKIQEVIKRRQIILVQVVKEERGNKGAALTTYLSLAGRYTVLMPNTARGGGISRKITNPQDRRRLKAIAQELEVPEGMGLIIRTAGAARTKQEIKRDFEYLLRLWESVRELTLQSTAPSLVYEEGDLIKRSIRDLYNKDVEEIVVAGEAGYQEAADFMRMLMPSHTRNVIAYKDATPLFTRYGVERQLNAMFQPQVTLRSGGYIVINQTEALVAIDVNSGKSTREFSIEETALATNLEAADEIARQLKLRDLAGLIVIDFIDMEEKRNNRSVERRLKEALRFDRARIQLGRISHFGLMEMSRQRLRTGVLEGSTSQCPHCQGTGIIRSTESIALAVLRGLEDAITAGANSPLVATTTPAVALYILNSKRGYVADMETRLGQSVTVLGSDRVHGANFTIERAATSALPARRLERAAVNMDWGFDGQEEAPPAEVSDVEVIVEADEADEGAPREGEGNRLEGQDNGGRRGRRRRRRGRGGRDRGEGRERHVFDSRSDASSSPQPSETAPPTDDELEFAAEDEPEAAGATDDAHPDDSRGERASRRRRRGRRGGRRGRERRPEDQAGAEGAAAADDAEQPDIDDDEAAVETAPERQETPLTEHAGRTGAAGDVGPSKTPGAHSKSTHPRRIWDVPTPANIAEEAPPPSVTRQPEPEQAPVAEVQPVAPQAPSRRRHEVGSSEPRIERVVVRPGEESGDVAGAQTAPQRKGWWQRKFGGE